MNYKYSKKFYLYVVGILILTGFLGKIFLTLSTKHLVTSHYLDEYLLSKYSPDMRYDQFYLLKKNNLDFNSYLFCTSACLVMNPDLLETGQRGFNLSIGAGQISDFLKYFNWILSNRNIPKKIFIGVEFYSFSDVKFVKSIPHEIESNIFLKIRNLYMDFSFEKYLLYKFIFNENTEIDKKKIKKLEYAKNGRRFYEDFFKRKNDNKAYQVHINKLANSIVKDDFDDSIALEQINKFNDLLEIAKKNDIEINIFFIPLHKKFLKLNNGSMYFDEIKLIEEIFKKTKINEIFYFNNFNKINNNYSFFERDLNHINYNAAKLVEYDLKNKKAATGMIISRKNLNNDITLLKKIYEKN